MENIIVRVAIGDGDATYVCDRAEYIRLHKSGARIIFALEYPDAETALREIPRY
jgi:hypothetical protein